MRAGFSPDQTSSHTTTPAVEFFLQVFLLSFRNFTMRVIASLLSSAALVAAHGYVSNGTIGGEEYEFYQPYTDPYTSPVPDRISRKIPGNGPVEDVTSIDLQCNGYSAGGTNGSEPAALHATVAAGSTVNLQWTLWPDSHVGPTLTYMARCPDTGCDAWLPGSEAVWFKVQEAGRTGTSDTWGAVSDLTLHPRRAFQLKHAVLPHGLREQGRRLHHPQLPLGRVLPGPPRDHRPARRLPVPWGAILPGLPPAQGHGRGQHRAVGPGCFPGAYSGMTRGLRTMRTSVSRVLRNYPCEILGIDIFSDHVYHPWACCLLLLDNVLSGGLE